MIKVLAGYFYEASAVAQRFVPRWDVMCDVRDGWRTSGTGQRPIPLLDLQCVKRSGSWRSSQQDISVGRQIYTTVLYISPDTAIRNKK